MRKVGLHLSRVAGEGTQATGRLIRQQKKYSVNPGCGVNTLREQNLPSLTAWKKITHQLGADLLVQQAYGTSKQMSKDGNHTTVLAVTLCSNRGASWPLWSMNDYNCLKCLPRGVKAQG